MRVDLLRILLGFLAGMQSVYPQTLHLGGVIGTHFTDGVGPLPDWNPIRAVSGSLIGGPMLELRWSKDFSVEVSAVHRNLSFDYYLQFPDGSRSDWLRANVGTWQFPILAKYALPLGSRVRPVIALGPSFRAVCNKAGTEPSPYGITTGAGVQMNLRGLSVAPMLRYTHWGGESWPHRPTVRNQVELLATIGYPTVTFGPREVG